MKPLDQFRKNPRNPDGIAKVCMVCADRAQAAEYARRFPLKSHDELLQNYGHIVKDMHTAILTDTEYLIQIAKETANG